jgi:hypothetical protein
MYSHPSLGFLHATTCPRDTSQGSTWCHMDIPSHIPR